MKFRKLKLEIEKKTIKIIMSGMINKKEKRD